MTTPAPLSYSTTEEQPRAAALVEANMVVTIADVASRLGKTEADLTALQRTTIVNAIIDAQAAVEAEIARPVVPVQNTYLGVAPYIIAPGGLFDPASWPVFAEVYDEVTILSATARPDGLTFDLVALVGLDGRKEEPIRAFIRAHAVEAVRLNPAINLGQIAVTSVSVEGQSISYEKRSVQAGAAGALPTLATLRHYKRRAAYQAPTRIGPPWPYGRRR